MGPEFQPRVRLTRLLPGDILALTERKQVEDNNSKSTHLSSKRRKHEDSRTEVKKSPDQTRLSDPKLQETRDDVCSLPQRRVPRTVKETQQILRILNQPNEHEEMEDEAASTAAFFQHLPGKQAMKQLNEVMLLQN